MMVKHVVSRSVRNLVRRKVKKPGEAPGAFTISESAVPTRIRVMRYNEGGFEEFEVSSAAEVSRIVQPNTFTWIDVQGLGDEAAILSLGEEFGIHPLAIADIVNTGQRPKVEEYDSSLFIITRMVRILETGANDWEQVSLFITESSVVTFQEHYGDCLDALRARIRIPGSRIRTHDAGYLTCMVLDAIVDGFFPVLEHLGERLDHIEQRLLSNPCNELLGDIFNAKRDLMSVRRSIWPQREAFTRLLRDGHALIHESVTPFLRDVYDHTVHVVDVTETYRELAQSYIDVYLSSVANRTNEVMRALTVLATIFIPLTFIAGVYGMNFDSSSRFNMPELRWRYGYVAFWGLCLVVTISMLIVGWKMKWIGAGMRARAARSANRGS